MKPSDGGIQHSWLGVEELPNSALHRPGRFELPVYELSFKRFAFKWVV